jgi:hypothetical protein
LCLFLLILPSSIGSKAINQRASLFRRQVFLVKPQITGTQIGGLDRQRYERFFDYLSKTMTTWQD